MKAVQVLSHGRPGEVIRVNRTSLRVVVSWPHQRIGRGCNLGQTEIEYLGAPTIGHKDIRRLDVAVHYALAVRGLKGVGNLDSNR